MDLGGGHALLAYGQRRSGGFSLIELMVVVAIVTILAVIAYPSYLEQTTKTRRGGGKSALLQIAVKQQQHYGNNKQYTLNLTDLGYSANTMYVNGSGEFFSAQGSDTYYSISVVTPSPVPNPVTTYTIQAVPLGAQQELDTDCGTLTLNQSRVRTAAGGGADCW